MIYKLSYRREFGNDDFEWYNILFQDNETEKAWAEFDKKKREKDISMIRLEKTELLLEWDHVLGMTKK